MPRYAFRIEYDGAPFSGWQRQSHCDSAQGALEAALSMLEPDLPAVAAAGRTDAGVHATAQVAHIDMARDWDPFRLSEALNHHLRPLPVAITAAARVPDDWHARFSATGRHYVYRLLNRRAPAALEAGLVWHVRHPLDAAAMHDAAQVLVGNHDFTTFRSTMCQAASPVKTIDSIQVASEVLPSGQAIRVSVSARSFLHNQVRSIVGSLERVGSGAWSAHDLAGALAAADRTRCGPVAPPQGLYLTGVDYPFDPFAP